MTVAATNQLTTQRIAAIRHLVYRTLLSRLPLASVEQAETFAANLCLFGRDRNRVPPGQRWRDIVRHTLSRHRELRVTPDIGETNFWCRVSDIEDELEKHFGSNLKHVAGFYFDGRWCLNLPEKCAVEGYKNQFGFYNGVLCQPLHSINKFFLLSSSAYGGERAIRLDARTRLYYEQYKNAAKQRHTADSAEL